MIKTIKATVITSDIVASSKMDKAARRKLQNKTNAFILAATKKYNDFKAEQFRGDSMQAVFTKNSAVALRTSISLFCFLNAANFKIRQSIGAGDISYSSGNVITSDGSAFKLSGENIDALKRKNELIAVTATNEAFTKEWQVHSETLNFLMNRLSAAQSEAVYLQLQNATQEEIAKALKISQPSVHQRLQAAGWSVFNSIIQRFEEIVPSL